MSCCLSFVFRLFVQSVHVAAEEHVACNALVTSSFLLLVVRPGATSSILATSRNAAYALVTSNFT